MGYRFKVLAMVATCFLLFGCAKNHAKAKKEIPSNEDSQRNVITKYNDLELCQVTDSFFMNKLNVNPASHPNYNNDLRYHALLENEISVRNINCYQIKNKVKPKNVEQLSPQQKRKQALLICQGYVQSTRYANPSVIFEMCIRGYKATKTRCDNDLARFNSEETKLTGAARAEYIEIGVAFRMGCNMN